jgi:hypothetical protein
VGSTDVRLLQSLFWIAIGLSLAHVVVALGMMILGNPEGLAGGVLYAFLYALPLVLIALALRSSRRWLLNVAGSAALLLAAYYSLVVGANWSGYSTQTSIFALGVSVPTVALDLVIFWATVVHRPGGRSLSPGAIS